MWPRFLLVCASSRCGARLLQAVLQLALALLACEPLLQLVLRCFRGRERAAHVGLRRFEVRDEVGLLPELVVELGLLQVQILGHRAELIDRRVAPPVDPVEELAAPHRFEHIRPSYRTEVGVPPLYASSARAVATALSASAFFWSPATCCLVRSMSSWSV